MEWPICIAVLGTAALLGQEVVRRALVACQISIDESRGIRSSSVVPRILLRSGEGIPLWPRRIIRSH